MPPCVTAAVVFDLHEQLASINRTATCITHGMEYARLEVSSGEDQLKFVCLWRVFVIHEGGTMFGISKSIVFVRGHQGWLIHILVFLCVWKDPF